MLTVKLIKNRIFESIEHKEPDGKPAMEYRQDTKIIEAETVDIYELEVNHLYEISAETGGSQYVFYVVNPQKELPSQITVVDTIYERAYIENSAGKTTEKVGW